MGENINGFVEVRDMRPETLKKHKPCWRPIICAGDFLGRNYNLFGVLAGVRWYNKNWDWEPIAMERGVPEDLSWQVNSKIMEFNPETGETELDPNHYGHTWMTLPQIDAFDWDMKITDMRWKNPPEDEANDAIEKRKLWRAGAITEKPADPFIEEFEISLYDFCDSFKTIRRLMEELVDIYGDSNVRLVIWFD